MKTVEATTVVGPDRMLVVQLPPGVSVGEHHVVVVIDESALAEAERPALPFSNYPVGLVSDSLTFRREDLYGDAV
ncbi:MAG TPA: hypothetical protein DDY78_15125 [Planctomycetales bacterium]|jgi:hypothetical protein|nr:hypothetical protein [Planctomycetales bacterium]